MRQAFEPFVHGEFGIHPAGYALFGGTYEDKSQSSYYDEHAQTRADIYACVYRYARKREGQEQRSHDNEPRRQTRNDAFDDGMSDNFGPEFFKIVVHEQSPLKLSAPSRGGHE